MDEPLSGTPPEPSGAHTHVPCSSFDMESMHTHRALYAVFNWLCQYPQRECWMGFFRRFWPIVCIPFAHLVIVFRDECLVGGAYIQ